MVTVSERPLNNSASICAVLLRTRPTTSGARTTVGAARAGVTSLSHWQSVGRPSSRSARKTGWRRECSCVHPLNLTRATRAGETQDGFSLVSGTESNGQAAAARSFNLPLNSSSFFASKPLPTCPMKRNFFPCRFLWRARRVLFRAPTDDRSSESARTLAAGVAGVACARAEALREGRIRRSREDRRRSKRRVSSKSDSGPEHARACVPASVRNRCDREHPEQRFLHQQLLGGLPRLREEKPVRDSAWRCQRRYESAAPGRHSQSGLARAHRPT